MKIKKRLSILVAFMLLIMVTFPVTGAFAEENSEQNKDTVKQVQAEKSRSAAAKNAGLEENSKGEVKKAFMEEKSEAEIAADQVQKDSNPETKGEPEEPDNSENQEDNAAEEINAPEENKAPENNTPEESEASEEDNAPAENGNAEEEQDPEGSEKEAAQADGETVPANENKSTQIHLHIDKCVNSVETAFVQVNGEWEEMTNPGSSPLYKSFDNGEFVKDDLTAFKLIFTTGEELVVPVSEVRVGVEAEGSVNYWLESCDLPAKEPAEQDDSENNDKTVNILSMIRIMIDETPRPIEKVTLIMMSGKRVDFERINELFSLTLKEEIKLEMIRGFEIAGSGETKIILLSQIKSFEIAEGVLTLQMNWDMEGEMVVDETEKADSEDETDTTPPGNNSGPGNPTDGTTNEQVWNGEVLPQTGESSRTMFYVIGFLIAAGGVMLRFKRPLKN